MQPSASAPSSRILRQVDKTGIVSSWCRTERHDGCSHHLGSGVVSRRKEVLVNLCVCTCHDRCPVKGGQEAYAGQWLSDCSCPGGARRKEILLQGKAATATRRAQHEEVVRDLDIRPGESAEEIQRKIVAGYEARGYDPHSDFSRISRFVAAGNARHGTRTIRLAVETVRGLRAVQRWTPPPPLGRSGETLSPAASQLLGRWNDHRARELRRIRRTASVFATLTAAAVAGSFFAKGSARLLLRILVAPFAAMTAWMGLWAAGVGLLDRISRNDPRPPPSLGNAR
jgi:hypothetical protein